MSELVKRLITAMTLCLTALLVHAQEWTKEDSLRLRKLLDLSLIHISEPTRP